MAEVCASDVNSAPESPDASHCGILAGPQRQVASLVERTARRRGLLIAGALASLSPLAARVRRQRPLNPFGPDPTNPNPAG